MAITVIVHLLNEDPVVGEVDEMPEPTDSVLIVQNPRRRDGKDVHYIDHNVTSVLWPWDRIYFLEVLPTEEQERIISFFRD